VSLLYYLVDVQVTPKHVRTLPGIDLKTTSATKGSIGQAHPVSAQRRPVVESARASESQSMGQSVAIHAGAVVDDSNLDWMLRISTGAYAYRNPMGHGLKRVVDEFSNCQRSALVASVPRSQDKIGRTDKAWSGDLSR
jgi:hypothetical protein